MLDTILDFLAKLAGVVAQIILYRAGKTAMQEQQQQETLNHVATAQKIAADIDKLDAAAVADRLRGKWQR